MCFAVSPDGMSSPSWLVRVRFVVLFFFGMSVSMVRQNFLGILLILCSSCLMKSALVCLTALFVEFFIALAKSMGGGGQNTLCPPNRTKTVGRIEQWFPNFFSSWPLGSWSTPAVAPQL